MTKSYYYIPTHFLYSPLLFFLLIFMHQLTYCHTLPKPFFKIFLFRIYAPTIHSTDFELDETSHQFTHISAPIQPPQTNPPTTQSHRYTRQYSHTKPIHQRPQTHTHTRTPQIPRPYGPTNAQQPQTHCPTDTNTTQNRPPTLTTLTPSHREAMPYPDVDAASAPFRTSAIGQARHQAGSD